MQSPRKGNSLQPATFLILPLRKGPGVINAISLIDNNLVQAMSLKFFTGDLFQVGRTGRKLEAAFSLPRRDVNLTIFNTGAATFLPPSPVPWGRLPACRWTSPSSIT